MPSHLGETLHEFPSDLLDGREKRDVHWKAHCQSWWDLWEKPWRVCSKRKSKEGTALVFVGRDGMAFSLIPWKDLRACQGKKSAIGTWQECEISNKRAAMWAGNSGLCF